MNPAGVFHPAFMRQQYIFRGILHRVPSAGGIIPKDQAHFFGGGIVSQYLNTIISDLLITGRIHQAILPAHISRIVNVFFLFFKNDIIILAHDPAPGSTAGFDITVICCC